MKQKRYKYIVYSLGVGSGSGTKCTSITDALNLARHMLKEGRGCTITEI